MSLLLIASIVIRLAAIIWAMVWSLVLLRRLQDRRMGFLTVLLGLMALRESVTLLGNRETGVISVISGAAEQPGIVLSIALFIAVPLFARMLIERTRVQDALRQSEAKFRALAETANSGVIISQGSRLVYINPFAQALVGYSKEELLSMDLWNLVHPDFRELVKARREARVQGDRNPSRYELKIVTKSGEEVWIEFADRPTEFEGKPALLGTAFDITERKIAEEALNASEERYRNIVETAQEGIWMVDAEARTTYANNHLAEMLGYTRDEMLGRSVFNYVDDADRLEAGKYLERGRDGIKQRHDFRFRRKDGSDLWAMASTTPLFDSAGRFVGGLAMLIDMTERRRSEKALKESEGLLQAAIGNLPFELWARDTEGRCIIQNPYSILQWGNLIGTLPEERAPEGEGPAPWDALSRRVYAGEVVKGESEITEGAQAGWYYHVVGPIRVDGEVRGILGVKIDITDRKRAEEALRQSEEKFRVLAQTIPSVIVVFQSSKIVFANSYAQTYSGYSEQELLSMDFWELIHPDHRQMVKERGLARLRGEAVPPRYEQKVMTKSGQERWVDSTVSLWEFEGEPSVLVTGFDITDRKRAEEALRETQQRLQHVLLCSPTTIYLLRVEDKSFTAEWVSEGVTRLTGYGQSEALSEGWWANHLHPDDRERALAGVPRLFTDDRLVHEYRFEHKDGGYLWLHDESRLLRDESGKPVETIGSWTDVTERREAEAALRNSEERFRTLVGSMDDIVFTLDRHQRYTGVFGRWIERFGIERQVLIGKTASEIHGVEAAHTDEEAIARVLKGEQVVYEWSLENDHGAFHFQTSLSPIRDHTGVVTGLVGVGRDVTEHRRAEAALRASEERYRDLVENARDIIYSHDLNGNYTSVNKAGEQITGYSREEALKMSFAQTVAPEHVQRAREMIARKLAGQKETVYDLEIIAKDGHRITVEVNTRLVYRDDVAVGVQGIARDVTQRKRAEEALRESQEHLQAILDNCPAMIFLKDLDGRYLQVNRQFERTFSLTAEQVLGRTDDELFPPELAAAFRATDLAVLEAGRSLEFEESAVYADGPHAYIVHKFPFHDASGNVYAVGGISTDITARKRAEEDLRQQKEILQKIFDHIPVMIRFRGEDGRVKLVNKEWERTLGWTLEELQQRDLDLLADAYPDPNYRKYVLDFIAAATGEWADFKTRLRDGRLIDTTWASVRLSDGTQIGFGRDITKRRRAEEALWAAQARTESVLASVADSHMLFDRKWRYLYVNQAAVRAIGRSHEQILGRTLWEIYPDIVGTELDRQYHRAMDERLPVAFDFHYATNDTWWANRFYPAPEGLAVFATNISESKRAEEALRQRTAQLAALHEIELEISAESELSRVLDIVTHRAAELLKASYSSLYTREREKAQLTLVASLHKDLIGLQLREGEGLAGRVAVTGRAEAIDDYSEWKGRATAFDQMQFGPSLGAPLKWQQSVIGTISLSRERGEQTFTEEDSHLLEQLAAEAAIAIHQAMLFEEVQDGQKRLQVLSHRLIDAQEAERKRLARELHDQIGQALTAVQISIQALQSSPQSNSASLVEDCLAIIDEALQQAQDLSLDLRPSLLDDLGLAAALRWYVDRVASRAGLVRCFDADSLGARQAPEVETACFRIAQEALTNVLRHAHARTVWVHVKDGRAGLQLIVRDDGVGFDVREAMRRTGGATSLGLQGMQERAVALGGSVHIESKHGVGAEVRACFPLKQMHS